MIKSPGDSLVDLLPDDVNDLLGVVKNSGMAIEINTSGYRKNVGEPYPGLDWLSIIREKSITLITGSDAHHPDQVGLKFESLYKRIKEEGINKLVVYDRRLQKECKI